MLRLMGRLCSFVLGAARQDRLATAAVPAAYSRSMVQLCARLSYTNTITNLVDMCGSRVRPAFIRVTSIASSRNAQETGPHGAEPRGRKKRRETKPAKGGGGGCMCV